MNGEFELHKKFMRQTYVIRLKYAIWGLCAGTFLCAQLVPSIHKCFCSRNVGIIMLLGKFQQEPEPSNRQESAVCGQSNSENYSFKKRA